jgi:type II secretory pathway predicted ATPase ExeA
MYETYWQLNEKPFENSADPRFYYPGESPQAALLKLRYAVENRRGGALLAGASGTGKTLVLAMLRRMIDETYAPFAHLVFPQMSTPDLLAYLADELEGSPRGAENNGVQTSIRRIERFLSENSAKGRHAVIAVDEAHLIDHPDAWEALRLLMNFEVESRPALSLLISGQTGLLPMLDRMPQFDERLGVKCLMRPFSVEETAAYATHRLKTAGATGEIIDPDAFPILHELTCGVARRINRLCDLALLIGYAEERHTLSAAHFESVCQELVTVAPE